MTKHQTIVASEDAASGKNSAIIYRMVMPDHLCPSGLKALHLLKAKGFAVEDHHLKTRAETDAFKAAHDVASTPQVWVDGKRIGGYTDLRAYFGRPVRDSNAVSYVPIIVLFSMTLLMALAVSTAAYGSPFTIGAGEWFISFSMIVLAMLKLQDIEKFSTMFLNYDLLARRWVPYAYFYPFLEGGAGVLMTAHRLPWLSIPVALFIGGIGAASVIKAVYVDKRELKCACVGGSASVPLGFVSLTENVMMVAMALWMATMVLIAPMH